MTVEWWFPDHPELGGFTTAEVAIARAWEVTPPGHHPEAPEIRTNTSESGMRLPENSPRAASTSATRPENPRDWETWVDPDNGILMAYIAEHWLPVEVVGPGRV
jgi:hypothetical protein